MSATIRNWIQTYWGNRNVTSILTPPNIKIIFEDPILGSSEILRHFISQIGSGELFYMGKDNCPSFMVFTSVEDINSSLDSIGYVTSIQFEYNE